jgi:hypothetical protein
MRVSYILKPGFFELRNSKAYLLLILKRMKDFDRSSSERQKKHTITIFMRKLVRG